MGRYSKILVAVDGSESSRNAFVQACNIGRDNGGSITAITVVPTLQGQYEVLDVEKASSSLKAEADKVLSEVKKVGEEHNLKVMLLLEEGRAFEEIPDAADKRGYNLIVMGRRGKKRVENALIGSVTARVIGNTDKDVLVVPKDATVGWGKILLATDGSLCSQAAVRRAIDLALSYGGEIIAVSVVDVNDEFQALAPEIVSGITQKAIAAMKAVKEQAEAAGVKTDTVVMEGEDYKAICELAKCRGANVIVMGTHGRTGLGKLLLGSATRKVIGHTHCPVLVVKAN